MLPEGLMETVLKCPTQLTNHDINAHYALPLTILLHPISSDPSEQSRTELQTENSVTISPSPHWKVW